MQPTTPSHRRGKIARLPRAVRDQLNLRLDDGHQADQILPWLNALPEVRQAMSRRFGGSAISAQNLSAWRQGGFQEWLVSRELFDTARHMRENVQEMEKNLGSAETDAMPRTIADYMVTQLSLRFATVLGRWDGSLVDDQITVLLKIGQFLLKLQQATYRTEREALELPGLQRKAKREYDTDIELDVMRKHLFGPRSIRPGNVASPFPPTTKPFIPRKRYVRSSPTPAKSSSIKVNQGSRPKQDSPPNPAQPPVIENIASTDDPQHTSHPSHASHPSAHPEDPPPPSPPKT